MASGRKNQGAWIRRVPPWEIPGLVATPEALVIGRRKLVKSMGVAASAVLIGCDMPFLGESEAQPAKEPPPSPETLARYPAKRNPKFKLDRKLTDEKVAAKYNNFYEFSTDKERVSELTGKFVTRPWTVEVTGMCHKPGTFDVDKLVQTMPIEERLYRHRCVEAWAMAVPWTGFPLAALLKKVEPLGSAKFVRFLSFLRPDQAPGQKEQAWYKWPYYEGLRMDEAMNDLALLVTGIYGHPLPKQHGAPIRLVAPWKYGFKSAKSIVHIELLAERPATFWPDVAPLEYDFLANVNPLVPHPRWSQATETMIGTDEKRPTLAYNGYGALVAGMYR